MVKSALRDVSRGLLAVTLMTAVFALCPCLAGAETAMEDCCPQSELSMTSACCDRTPRATEAVSPTPVLVLMSTPAVIHAVAIQPTAFVSFHTQATLARPVVARTILRI